MLVAPESRGTWRYPSDLARDALVCRRCVVEGGEDVFGLGGQGVGGGDLVSVEVDGDVL